METPAQVMRGRWGGNRQTGRSRSALASFLTASAVVVGLGVDVMAHSWISIRIFIGSPKGLGDRAVRSSLSHWDE